MKRRAFISLLSSSAPAAQSIRGKPTCPVCHFPLPQGTPLLRPVVAGEDGVTISTLPNLRAMICGNCGTQFVCTL